ncbi:MAG: GntR family transcriptional regulator [Acidobacteria bacterium]|nr:GntR family transcriptional regulator [Acidobacteriota bacterium]|tara:strand:- start:3177 stop:3860 length:684 start_codon:yes stop_codon:yes gene_type:complete
MKIEQTASDTQSPKSKAQSAGATERVYLGILQSLEQHRMVPGQRLIETELAIQFGVGRNAVREAMQRLAVRGVVDLKPNQSASIRKLDIAETVEILEVAADLTSLAAGFAADKYDPALHGEILGNVEEAFKACEDLREPSDFSRARRQFYRTLLVIGANRELQRLFMAIGVHVIYSQHQTYELQQIRLADYRAICKAVRSRDVGLAKAAGRDHVEHERDFIVKRSRI